MQEPRVSIILRSFNEAWALKETLPAIAAQDWPEWELIVIDSGSTDGSVELIRAARPKHFVQIEPHEYNPSRVMNRGMRLASSETCIFLNADATPQSTQWLRPLALALQDPQVAAVFGRQIPRPDCLPVFACDYDRCFGPNRESARWENFFSMVSSGIRKDIWAKRGFREDLQYAEDAEYTQWCRDQGCRIAYCEESIVMHSHNYTPEQSYRRTYGDARASAASWKGNPAKVTWFNTVAVGWMRDLMHDYRYAKAHRTWNALAHSARIRWAQRTGRFDGFHAGWRDYRSIA